MSVREPSPWVLPGLLLALLALLAWDASGLDLLLARCFGDATGFAARDAFWARSLLHDGGRWASGMGLLLGGIEALRRAPVRQGPSRRERRRALLATVLLMLAISALKQLSRSSCPWSLAEFGGGSSVWVSHWNWWQTDGGPGHCFPSGHAAASFAFVAWLWIWAPWRAQRPWVWALLCLAVLGGGMLGALAQSARGAHYLSHSLWTAWLCAALGWLLLRQRTAAVPETPSPNPA